MFFQALIYIVIILLALWLAWKYIAQPVLEGYGIEVDDDLEEIRNNHTKRLERLLEELADKKAAQEAAIESVELVKEIKALEDQIKDAEEAMKL
jgi:biopolymer transport protein ExbB/TolQ